MLYPLQGHVAEGRRELIPPASLTGFPGRASGKEHTCQCRRCEKCGFSHLVEKSPWRGAWQPTPIFLPGESHGPKNLVGYSLRGCKELDTTEVTSHAHTHTHTHTHTHLLNTTDSAPRLHASLWGPQALWTPYPWY